MTKINKIRYRTVPNFVLRLVFFLVPSELVMVVIPRAKPKSITFKGDSSVLSSKRKFSGFKSLLI